MEDQGDQIVIGTNLPYSEFVELGVRPHKITPKDKKALKFKKGGEEVIVKSVQHPGFEGYHMFRGAVDYFERELPRRLKR